MYKYSFIEDWKKYFNKLPENIKYRVIKKINYIIEYPYKRHLKGSVKFFVSEIGQYRLVYRIFEDKKEIRFYFVGRHKDYEKWYKSFQ